MATARAGEVAAIARGAASTSPPFDLVIDAAGGRISRRGSIAWLSVGEGAAAVIALADELRARCPQDLTLGAPPKRAQSAHLSVARVVDARLIAALRATEHGRLEVGWRAEEVVVYRSHLTGQGSWYEPLAVAPIAGRT